MDYLLHIIIMINIYIILCTTTNLMVGMTNLVSMGQAAFYAVGAYVTTLSLMYFHFSLLPTLLLVMVANIILSIIIAIPTLRLKGDYFILGTLGFQLIIYTILYNWIGVTKGPYGISGIPSPTIFGFEISGTGGFLILSSLLMALCLYVFYHLLKSPFGRVLMALREDEIALSSLGRNPVAFKIWAFVVSSMFLGFAGFLFASYISYIDPTSFSLDESIFILAAVLIGGTGNLKGPIVGAIFVIILPELLRFVGLPDSIAAPMKQIIYGLALILVARYRPQGIAGAFKFE
ncbi:branched-chain amino acid ABC transporter permease [Arcicella sp. LKC2W]|uniref:branched-chain amino acid ABC transporter permease n=1 Tax=Arcicella sp. LKC2W TaxID=2984198 RepID=UPI002B21424E|nr:branched-chain amino acid ABC transporter permease [Arcicella sp. LKC2W]MEA5461664.1 branched-chain amino acid ABC transporter permease [Arcicella sp. LKC2W]